MQEFAAPVIQQMMEFDSIIKMLLLLPRMFFEREKWGGGEREREGRGREKEEMAREKESCYSHDAQNTANTEAQHIQISGKIPLHVHITQSAD